MRKISSGKVKKKDQLKVMEQLRKIRNENAGTAAARDADRAMGRLRKA